MNACPNCGAIPRPNDRFCNTCGTPVAAAQPPAYGAPPAPAAPPGYAAPQGQWAGGQTPRCQQGHEIPPGQNYCAQGHPIALEGMQFAGGGNYPPQQQGYGQQQGYAAPYQGGYGGQAGGQQQQYGYAPPQAPPGYAPPQGAYAPQAAQPAPAYNKPSAPAPADAAAPQGRVLRGFLVSYQTNQLGDFWALFSGRSTIGRSNSGEALDVPLADATISSRHAAITIDAGAGAMTIEDTGSTNGTFVNDEHLGFNGRRELRDGDRVRFGGYTAIIKVVSRS